MDGQNTNLIAKVATLEANQNHLANTLATVVTELKTIVLTLEARKGAEKLALSAFGGLLVLVGGIANHLLR